MNPLDMAWSVLKASGRRPEGPHSRGIPVGGSKTPPTYSQGPGARPFNRERPSELDASEYNSKPATTGPVQVTGTDGPPLPSSPLNDRQLEEDAMWEHLKDRNVPQGVNNEQMINEALDDADFTYDFHDDSPLYGGGYMGARTAEGTPLDEERDYFNQQMLEYPDDYGIEPAIGGAHRGIQGSLPAGREGVSHQDRLRETGLYPPPQSLGVIPRR